MTLVSALVDQREPPWVRQLQFGGVPVLTMLLETGDLLATTDDGATLAVERKTSGDFLNSLRDGRLFDQCSRLRQVSPWAYLVVTGTLHSGPHNLTVTDERETGWNWDSVAGALLTVQEIGVHVVQVASDLDYEAAILRLANRERGPLRTHPTRGTEAMSDGEAVLCALPGVGPERAAALLKQMSPAMALAWLTAPAHLWDPPFTVQGVSDGTKRGVRRALGLNDGWCLHYMYYTEGEEQQ